MDMPTYGIIPKKSLQIKKKRLELQGFFNEFQPSTYSFRRTAEKLGRLVDVIDLDCLKNLCFHKMTDAAFSHHGNGDGLLNALDHLGIAHSGDTAGGTNIGRNSLERHDRSCTGLFRNLRLLWRGDIHNHAALEHLCKILVESYLFCDIPNFLLIFLGREIVQSRWYYKNIQITFILYIQMTYIISKKSAKPAYFQLYEQIKNDIICGTFPLHSKLPSKRTLSSDTA